MGLSYALLYTVSTLVGCVWREDSRFYAADTGCQFCENSRQVGERCATLNEITGGDLTCRDQVERFTYGPRRVVEGSLESQFVVVNPVCIQADGCVCRATAEQAHPTRLARQPNGLLPDFRASNTLDDQICTPPSLRT